jgi:AGZA family xanthine/uracil permease-like MFS transporter
VKGWFDRGDIDGFFGLFVDNLLQLMLIATLGPIICGFPLELVVGTILPAAAVSILAGNFFYAWQARRLARETGRSDVTALPYGINTVSLIAYIFLIMGPVYRETGDYELAWKTGLFACLLSALIEAGGGLVGDALRRWTPRAALLSSLAGIALTFISMGFVFQIFASPLTALLPMFLILVCYASRVQLPLKLPAGFVAVVVGVALAWTLNGLGLLDLAETGVPESTIGLYLPVPVFSEVISFLSSPTGWAYLSVILPMGLFNVIGSLQCLESAEAAGDNYPTRSSLLANGGGTLVAALLGSAFPTTIYIGHPGWKAMGARHQYSVINGIVIALICFTGSMPWLLQLIPLEAMIGILVWIGLVITAQAFQETPRHHALAVGAGLLPALAAWALLLIQTSLQVTGSSLQEAAGLFGNQLFVEGIFALNQGFIISSMVLAAILAHAIDRQFHQAAAWAGIAALLSAIGLIHAYQLSASGLQNYFGFWAAGDFALAYAVIAFVLLLIGHFHRRNLSTE